MRQRGETLQKLKKYLDSILTDQYLIQIIYLLLLNIRQNTTSEVTSVVSGFYT